MAGNPTCSNCGRVNRPNAKFCSGCGKPLATSAPPPSAPPGPAARPPVVPNIPSWQPPAAAPSSGPQPAQDREKRSRITWWLVLIIALLFALCACASIAYFAGDQIVSLFFRS